MLNSYLNADELAALGLKSCGMNVRISRFTRFYGASKISIGNCVRIDDFCILSGNITLGSYIHIAPYCGLFSGAARIVMENYTALSAKGVIYAQSDDYSGRHMTNPTLPDKFTHMHAADVVFEKHAIVGAGCTILPGVRLGHGSAVGANSLVMKDIEPYTIYAGSPARKIKERERVFDEMELDLMYV